ncbi:acyl carrier protein [Actinomadura graeca]|uniref:Acyl carrier protein n=1 Tax=Actinomadura graeca TaxID=2750812 RepID=A0ABX8QY72_9ACTN|nr:acyl carrier protein [Actinomadura graeca]QXJ23789.1 acyl carrier protein [Actinomadura graeca]
MAVASNEEILAAVRVEAKALVPDLDTGRLGPGVPIAEVGIGSVQMLELVARLEDRLGVTLPDYELASVESVAELVRLVARAQAEAG